MHGIIFAELQKYAQSSFGPKAWGRVVEEAKVPRGTYLASNTYADSELVALVAAASTISGIPAPKLLFGFGEFIVPDLLKIFGAFVQPEWTALDLLEHTETVIHRSVRLHDPSAAPPLLRISRTSPREVEIRYSSPRRLCAVARGIIQGVGKHYGTSLAVDEPTCMMTGNPECLLKVRMH
jgi:hypothetical protein